MAESRKTTKKTTTTTHNAWGLSKISFYCIGAMAILYMIATALSLLKISSMIVGILQGLATAIAICIAAIIAWNYVRHKSTVWKVLYLVFILIVLIGIVIPMI